MKPDTIRDDRLIITETRTGKGVILAAPVAAGTVVARFAGPVVPLDQVPREELNYIVRIDRERFLIPGAPARFINHSCTPNCELSDNLEFVTRKPLPSGTELTISYNRVSADEAAAWDGVFWHPAWTFHCRCGAAGCVGTIDRYITEGPP